MAAQTVTVNVARSRPRLWEVDAVRGLAVALMIFFHLMWDLQVLGISNVNVFSLPWQALARGIGSTFIFVMGVSLTLDAARHADDARSLWRRHLKRGATIFGLGMLVTLATLIIVGDAFVRFGILHLAGAAIILATPFMRARAWVSAAAGVIVIAVGVYFQTLSAPFPWPIPLGVRQTGVSMVDYYPLAPWFGVALFGVAFGKIFYPQGVRRFALPDLGALAPVQMLRLLGRHSLLIYLVHQPILIALIIIALQLRLL